MSLVKYAVSTEKSMRLIESENKLAFIVDRKAKKQEIKDEIEKRFGVKIIKVNTMIGPDGKKKAYVSFSEETPALDVATKLGMM